MNTELLEQPSAELTTQDRAAIALSSSKAREALARQVAEAKAQADAIAATHLAEAIAELVTEKPAPMFAPIAPVVMRRPPPARTAPPVIAAPVARVYTDDVPNSSDIYAMTAESETADKFTRWLCTMAGIAFPPVNQGVSA